MTAGPTDPSMPLLVAKQHVPRLPTHASAASA